MAITIDTINEEWSKDSEDFRTDPDLSKHSRNQLSLHQKYYSMLVKMVSKKNKLNSLYAELKSNKIDYYSGEMDLPKMKELGWPVYGKRLVKSEVSKVMDADPDIIKFIETIAETDNCIRYLEDIVKKLNQRSFDIKNIIEYEKFVSGVA